MSSVEHETFAEHIKGFNIKRQRERAQTSDRARRFSLANPWSYPSWRGRMNRMGNRRCGPWYEVSRELVGMPPFPFLSILHAPRRTWRDFVVEMLDDTRFIPIAFARVLRDARCEFLSFTIRDLHRDYPLATYLSSLSLLFFFYICARAFFIREMQYAVISRERRIHISYVCHAKKYRLLIFSFRQKHILR